MKRVESKSRQGFRADVWAGRVHLRVTPERGRRTRGRQEGPLFRVWRKTIADHGFGVSGRGHAYRQGELIHKGAIPCGEDGVFEFIDDQVQPRAAYAYWVTAGSNEPVLGPAVVSVRDPEVWWPIARVESEMRVLADEFPGRVRMKAIGKTARGRTLYGILAGNRRRAVALIGAVHAGESGPELILPALRRILAENRRLLKKVGIVALPSVNIDEREREITGAPRYLRTNANGVDLNRNFDADWRVVDYRYNAKSSLRGSTYRGPKPASEPETPAASDFLLQAKPKAAFCFHCLAGVTGAMFLAPHKPGAMRAPQYEVYRQRCARIVSAYTKAYYGHSGPAPVDCRPGCCPGSLPYWLFKRLHIPAFDLEAGRTLGAAFDAVVKDATTREILAEFQQRHYRGIVAAMRLLARRSAKPARAHAFAGTRALSNRRVVLGKANAVSAADPRQIDWRRAKCLAPFVTPATATARPRARTTCHIAHGQTRLHLRFQCVESRAGSRAAVSKPRGKTAPNDWIEILIQTRSSKPMDFRFISIERSGKLKAFLFRDGTRGPGWKIAGLQLHVARGQGKWTAWLGIPFRALGTAPRPGRTWRFNVLRQGDAPRRGIWSCTYGATYVPGRWGTIAFR
ncbi:MAG: hypothetical protein JXR37_14705 [Kiritimatiellae bacterium]|nr:hypothetical protein [Kiritimatiellia bacterium]